ncbi:hypothetical protein Ga0102493_111774 [Erythrobacter litoralis]|uniref:Alginate export domain-containing protein n=1 Tax=Erythrobacter litoralis TaxID=39960 RepID=A0A074MM19_9SPHN|nr:hypothetical protein [Erythrobacter litoralis]AOL22796.1 hypothetical protein Ga0102493_111774 [Erythrobacter litoralis]KEO92903.1 hypothetical protein EH32_14015 [Erythrobacter litoralis]
MSLLLLPAALFAQSAPPPEEPDKPADQQQPEWEKDAPPVDPEIIEGRERPGFNDELPEEIEQDNPGAVRAPPPQAFPKDQLPIPDRWRLIESLGLVRESLIDPYNQNTYKGDRPINPDKVPWLPITGDDWFFVANLISDTVYEPRTFPIPVGIQTTEDPDRLDVFGDDFSTVLSQTFIAGFALLKGSTAYKPPSVEYRVTLAYNVNYVDVPERRVLFVEPSLESDRLDHFLGVQEAFVDYHFTQFDTSRFDFISIRAGIQPFQSDFRGFLFNDQQLGVRLFGSRDNNRVQFNLGAFWRLEKDTNSGLNSIVQSPRDDLVFVANLYRQDFLIPALTSQFTVVYNRNREADDIEIDDNGFPVRPALLGNLRGRDYDVVYLGYNADGRIGRVNITASAYWALGENRDNFFTGRPSDINAQFYAAELSYDKDWMRFRLSGAYQSGDSDPFDDDETGFDAIFENPVFAGADTSYWIRQTIPFAGGGRAVSVNGRNGLLNNLRSSKEQGQSNFNNPGLILAGVGADFDLTPEFRLSANANHLWFEDTAVVETLRNEGSIPREIGFDLSAAAIWRPKATQNIVVRLSAATLLAGDGFRDLFDNLGGQNEFYSVLANVVLTY